jgi:predicted RNase H-like HicB family nuclease
MTERRYLILIEGNEETNFSAFAADLPGCVAAGATREEVERAMHDAIEFHLEGLHNAGESIPEPSELGTSHVDVAP